MKNYIRKTFYITAITVIGIYSFKTHNSYNASNMFDNDALFMENVLALSDMGGDYKENAINNTTKETTEEFMVVDDTMQYKRICVEYTTDCVHTGRKISVIKQ